MRWNADAAQDTLVALWPHSEPILERELTVGDQQSRRIAFYILSNKQVDPLPAMFEVAASLLDRYGWTGDRAAMYLYDWHDDARAYLMPCLDSPDRKTRLRAATVLGYAGDRDAAADIARVLIPHLTNNRISGDARAAVPALYRCGPAILPHLKSQLDQHDEQARAIMLHIIERLEHPGRTLKECEAPLPEVTGLVHDPLTELGIWYALDGI